MTIQGASTGFAIGSVLGGTLGAISLPFKNSNRFVIDGNFNNWKTFQTFILHAGETTAAMRAPTD